MDKKLASDITLWMFLLIVVGLALLLSMCAGCATTPMKFANQQMEHEAQAGLECLKNNDIPGAQARFGNIINLTSCWKMVYGRTTEDTTDETLGIAIYRMQTDAMFKLGQTLLGAAGGFLGLSPGDLATGGAGTGLLAMLITFALGYLKKRKEATVAQQKVEEAEKIQYAQAAAIELGSIKNPALGTVMKDEVKSRALAGTRQDEIVQQAVSDLRSDMGAQIVVEEIPEDTK